MTTRPFTTADLAAAMALVDNHRAPDAPWLSGAQIGAGLSLRSPLAGVKIVTSPLLTETVLHARSPSRARRRAAQGHRQHTREIPSTNAYTLPDGSLVMHPIRYQEIKARLDAEVAELVARR